MKKRYIVLALMTALGVSYWLSALDVVYRDVRYVIPFLTQMWLFASPVVYPSTMVPEAWRALYGLNPMVGVIEGFRWALLDAKPPEFLMLVISGVMIVLLFGGGLMYFSHMEQTIADQI